MEEEAAGKKKALNVEPAWEFTAPKYYDFCVGETEVEKVAAEFWFANARSYDASPHAGKSKPVAELLHLEAQDEDMEEVAACTSPSQNKENETDIRTISFTTPPGKAFDAANVAVIDKAEEDATHEVHEMQTEHETSPDAGVSPSTPKTSQEGSVRSTDRRPFTVMPSLASSPGSLPAKRLHSQGWKEVQAPVPATMPKPQSSLIPRRHLTSAKKNEIKKTSSVGAKTFVSPDDPANKKQKLEGGRLRQIKERLVRPNDPPPVATKPQEFKFCTDKRSRLHGGADTVISTTQAGRSTSQFVSMAEQVRLFQCKTPERFHLNPSGQQHEVDDHEKRKMKLTRPKTPEFETSHRVRPTKMKSTADLEVEMLARIPKFKARPAPKKILEAHPPPVVQKQPPALPEFQEFHFRTTERALQHKGTTVEHRVDMHDRASVATSTDSQMVADLKQRRKSAPESNNLSEPREPHLHTAARVRPSTVKSREELELDELSKIPKFKARPLNKRIFESRGDLGIFRNNKREATVPQEFHFATEERIQHREPTLAEQFGKMTLQQKSTQGPVLRPTVPEPFNLETENRGLVKEMRFLQEVLTREQEEMEARVPRAHPLPFTTDVPAIPPKPEPRECTRPEPFQLESLIRHEEVLHKFAEERERANEMEAALKAFRAQPNLSDAPVFVPSRSRKPLTEVHEFTFHLDSRAVERADFDQRVAEKQNQYKRFREEYEAARKAEEERSIKAMRREMVPHARPMPVYSRPFVPHRSTKGLTRPVSPQFNFPPSRQPSSERRRFSSTSMASLRRRMGQMH